MNTLENWFFKYLSSYVIKKQDFNWVWKKFGKKTNYVLQLSALFLSNNRLGFQGTLQK